MDGRKRVCPDCGESVTRRDFMKTAAGAAALAAVPSVVRASPFAGEKPEELVRRLHGSLTDKQKSAVCFGWDHPNRQKVSNNWKIVDQEIGTFFTADQQAMIKDIFKGVTNEGFHERWWKEMKDDSGGFEKYHVAIFRKGESETLQWVLTGRHVTIRCDADSEPGAAFGGPIFYGHAAEGFNEKPDHPGNVFWHQARLANRVFETFDGRQREKALVAKSPPDDAKSIEIRPNGPFDGIGVAELSKDQKRVVEECLKLLLEPYRASDVEEAMRFIQEAGGLDKLHLSFYKEGDIGEDGVWDRWMVRGPNMAWYFRGSPHVHTWVKVVQKA